METNYFKERAREANEETKKIVQNLPPFCREYFVGIESVTSPLTRLGYARDLKIFFEFLVEEVFAFRGCEIEKLNHNDLEKITAFDVELFLSHISDYKKNDRNFSNEARAKARKLSAVRSLLKYFFRNNKISSCVADKVRVPKILEKEIVRLEVDEVVKILDGAESGFSLTQKQKDYNNITKARDVALLTLLLGTGMRVSECVGLNVNDVDFGVNGVRVTRKGGKTAALYFGDEVEKALLNWLEERVEKAKKEKRDDSEPALFVSLHGGRLGVRAVQNLVKKYAVAAAPLKNITPHKLRSTYGTNLYRETKDIYVVADVLGHKDVNTTKKHYAALSEDIRRDVANKVKLR